MDFGKIWCSLGNEMKPHEITILQIKTSMILAIAYGLT